METARGFEANDVLVAFSFFLSIFFFFLLGVLNVNIAFTTEQTQIVTNIIKAENKPQLSSKSDWHF